MNEEYILSQIDLYKNMINLYQAHIDKLHTIIKPNPSPPDIINTTYFNDDDDQEKIWERIRDTKIQPDYQTLLRDDNIVKSNIEISEIPEIPEIPILDKLVNLSKLSRHNVLYNIHITAKKNIMNLSKLDSSILNNVDDRITEESNRLLKDYLRSA